MCVYIGVCACKLKCVLMYNMIHDIVEPPTCEDHFDVQT